MSFSGEKYTPLEFHLDVNARWYLGLATIRDSRHATSRAGGGGRSGAAYRSSSMGMMRLVSESASSHILSRSSDGRS